MKKFIQAIILSFLALGNLCLAVGSTPIEGETADGWSISIDTDDDSNPRISIWRKNDETYKSHQEFSFAEEHCEFGAAGGITCPTSAKSPLAGTTYTRHSVESCDVESVYLCVSGCNINGRAPFTLTQSLYEGDPYCGLTDKEIKKAEEMESCGLRIHNPDGEGRLIGDKVKLRDAPGIDGKVMRILAAGTALKINGVRSSCEIHGGKGGEWMEVEVSVGTTTETGFIFDSHIKYDGE